MNMLRTLRVQAECLLTLVGGDCSVATTRRQLQSLEAFLKGRHAMPGTDLVEALEYLDRIPSAADRLLLVQHTLQLLHILAESQTVDMLVGAAGVA